MFQEILRTIDTQCAVMQQNALDAAHDSQQARENAVMASLVARNHRDLLLQSQQPQAVPPHPRRQPPPPPPRRLQPTRIG